MTWLFDNLAMVGEYLVSHLALAIPPIVASFVLAVPIAWLANRVGWLRTPGLRPGSWTRLWLITPRWAA